MSAESVDAATTFHVRRAAHGNGESLDWIVQRLSPLLLEHARYRLGPILRRHHDPEDVVHEAWLVALPRLRELPERDGRLTPVLLRFLTTAILNLVRNLVRRHASGTGQQAAEEGRGGFADVAAAESGVVSRAIRREVQDEVRIALAELGSGEREVLLLRGVEQQTNATVGLLLGISAEAVSKRYRRALQTLRTRLPGSVFAEFADD